MREHPLGKMAERTVGRIIAEQKGSFKRVGLEGAFSQYLERKPVRLKQKIAGDNGNPSMMSMKKNLRRDTMYILQ